jgi:hypothetical protein
MTDHFPGLVHVIQIKSGGVALLKLDTWTYQILQAFLLYIYRVPPYKCMCSNCWRRCNMYSNVMLRRVLHVFCYKRLFVACEWTAIFPRVTSVPYTDKSDLHYDNNNYNIVESEAKRTQTYQNSELLLPDINIWQKYILSKYPFRSTWNYHVFFMVLAHLILAFVKINWRYRIEHFLLFFRHKCTAPILML